MDGVGRRTLTTCGFFARVHHAAVDRMLITPAVVAAAALSRLRNAQRPRLSRRVARQHYDLPNKLYVTMLGRTMQYTCAYYGAIGTAGTLDEAQERKLDLVARKLHIEPGMTVLELGGGFGGLARHLALQHQCRVVGYNIARRKSSSHGPGARDCRWSSGCRTTAKPRATRRATIGSSASA